MRQLLTRRFDVPLDLPSAWRRLAALEQWPTWARHIRRIEVTPAGPIGPTTAGRIHLSNGITSTFRMTEFEEGRAWKWVGPFLGLQVHYDHQFEPVGLHCTRLTWTLKAEGFAVALLGPLFAAIYGRNLDRAIANFVSSCGVDARPPSARAHD